MRRRGDLDVMMAATIAALVLLVAIGMTGCGDAWTARRTACDASYYGATAAYVLIQAQAATGTIPDGMTGEEFAAQIAKADAAYIQVQTAYTACILAVETKDAAGYQAGMTQLGMGAVTVLQVKAAVCPYLSEDDDDD